MASLPTHSSSATPVVRPQGSWLRGTRRSIYWGWLEGSRKFGNWVIVAFLLAQAADGVFTYVGLTGHVPVTEGNPLLAWLMQGLGTGPALAGAKCTAAGFGMLLHLTQTHRIVAALTAVYVVAALVPWAAILFHGGI